jgi:hypothetical protein
MAKYRFDVGAEYEALTRDELGEELRRAAQTSQQEYARGMKYLRMSPAVAPVAGGAFSFDGSQSAGHGPREGFLWTIRRLLVSGLAAGTTPDVINFYRGSPQGVPVWQLNGNSFGQTFGKCELLLLGGEVLSFANLGTVTATGQIVVTADILEVAAEEIFKLY